MRTLSALALVLLACAPADRSDATAARDAQPVTSPRGPDPIILRVPRGGGLATAYVHPRLDSLAWRSSSRVPPLGRILAFDAEGGSLAFVDSAGRPGRLDLRLGSVTMERGAARLRALESADGYGVYGVTPDGDVVRLTPAGTPWTFKPPRPARSVLPQPDGWLHVLGGRDDETIVWRLHPPESQITDSLVLPRTGRTARTGVGDRLYFAVGSELIGVRSQGLARVRAATFTEPIRALAVTPSGDRVYVATDSSPRITVVDRFREEISARLQLPGIARDLRMDPLGRLLLVRAASGDSAWVLSVSTGQVLGMAATAWRNDLPLVLPGGEVALLRGNDVVLVDGGSLRELGTVSGGGRDYWYQLRWGGFRPRAEGLDEPVEFRVRPPPIDTAPLPYPGLEPPAVEQPSPADTIAPAPVPRRPAPAQLTGIYVSFARQINEARARELASEISVEGQRARVIREGSAGTPIFRVVLGPFGSREEAERVGRASGRPYVVYEGGT